jgi:hypothetical protein
LVLTENEKREKRSKRTGRFYLATELEFVILEAASVPKADPFKTSLARQILHLWTFVMVDALWGF